MRLLKTLLVLFVWAAGPAVAEPLNDGLDAAQKGDYATALRLWRPLANWGDAIAQNNLGVMYAKGLGVPQDYVQAVEWYRKAADQGVALALFNLGALYDMGEGVPKDYVLAHMWYDLAASRFDMSQKEDRDRAIKHREDVVAKMTPAQIAEAQKLAREWMPKQKR